MALHIDWTEHDTLTPREQYDAAGRVADDAKAAAALRRARIAHDLAAGHGAIRAGEILGVSDKRIYRMAADYRAAQPVIASRTPGRKIVSYDLLDEVTGTYGLARSDAHDAIHALLDDLIQIDGEDEVVIAREPVRSALLTSNPGDVDVYYWLTVREETATHIREALAAMYASV